MARSRNIKPGFFQNDELVDLDFGVRLLFIGLWTLADREGRLENRPKKIKMQLFPADELDVHGALLGLSKRGLISIYDIDNVEYIQIINFLKHQHPHIKEQASTIPAPDMHHACPSDSLLPITDSLNPITSKRTVRPKKTNGRFKPPTIEEIKTYVQEKHYSVDSERFWNFYESKDWMVGKNKMQKWKAALANWSKSDNENNDSISTIGRIV